jgi:hypothetical protein
VGGVAGEVNECNGLVSTVDFRIARNTGLDRMAAGAVYAPVLFRNAQALRVGIAGVAEPGLVVVSVSPRAVTAKLRYDNFHLPAFS